MKGEIAEIAESAIVYPGTLVGDGCRILDGAVVGKPPTLGPRSTTKQEDLPRGGQGAVCPAEGSLPPARRTCAERGATEPLQGQL